MPIIERLKQINSPYKESQYGKPIVTYDDWTIYLSENNSLILLDLENNQVVEVECIGYHNSDVIVIASELENKSNYCGEFDDFTGCGYFIIKEDK